MAMKSDSIPKEPKVVKKTHEVRLDSEGKGYLYRFDKEEKAKAPVAPVKKSKKKNK